MVARRATDERQGTLDLRPPDRAVRERVLRSVAQRADAWSALVTSKPESIARINREVLAGNVSDYVRAADHAEEDYEIQHALNTRKAAVLACPIEIAPADDSVRAEEIAAGVRELWNGISERREALDDLLDAIPLGFALGQLILSAEPRDGLWRVERIDTLPPEALLFNHNGAVLDFPRLRATDGAFGGLDLYPYRPMLVFHQRRRRGSCLRGGLMRTLLWYSLFKRFSIKDWLAFNEKYGSPFLVGRYPTTAQKTEQDALYRALKDMGADAAAVIPDGTSVEIHEAGRASSVAAYERFVSLCDGASVKVILGQTKTSSGEGGSYALARVHNDVRADLTAADCEALGETLQRQLVERLTVWNWGPAALPLAPRLRLVYQEPEDRLTEAQILQVGAGLGVPIPVSYARARLGIPEPADGEETLQPADGGAGGGPFAAAQPRRQPMEADPWLR